MANKEQYRLICTQRKDIPLFLRDWWLDAVCDDWDAAVVMNGDHIAGVWPYRTENKVGVSLFRNPVLTPYLGPHVFYPPDLKETKRDNFEHEIIAKLLQQIPAAKVWSVALFPGQKQVGLFRGNGFTVTPRQTFIMPLEDNEENIFARLHEDYRRNIRKAEKEYTITDEPGMLHDLRKYQEATLNRKDVQVYFTAPQLEKVFAACRNNNSTALWVARKEGMPQAILWHVWDESRAYYLAGAKNPAVKDNRAMTALIWKAISEARRMGKQSFDFEGSMDAGVEHFFRNFGGQRELYMVINKNSSWLWKLKELIG